MSKPGLLYTDWRDHLKNLAKDLFIFVIKSILYICETIFLTLIPDRFRKLKDVSNQVVLITGGAGGVGRELALRFAGKGALVVIWDVNNDVILSAINFLNSKGLSAKGYTVDVSDREAVYRTAAKVRQDVGPVDILINNAGIVCCKTMLELPDKAIENTFAVNILAHYWTIKSFLPDMIRQKRGHIVTIASVTGLIGVYGCTDYSATKFACIGLHESLNCELKAHGHDYINLTCVCPYFINTGMFSGCRPRLFPMLEPSHVAEETLKAVQKNQVSCVLPGSARIIFPLKNYIPAKVNWEMMTRVIRGPDSMKLFNARGKAQSG